MSGFQTLGGDTRTFGITMPETQKPRRGGIRSCCHGRGATCPSGRCRCRCRRPGHIRIPRTGRAPPSAACPSGQTNVKRDRGVKRKTDRIPGDVNPPLCLPDLLISCSLRVPCESVLQAVQAYRFEVQALICRMPP